MIAATIAETAATIAETAAEGLRQELRDHGLGPGVATINGAQTPVADSSSGEPRRAESPRRVGAV
jgi:hypothetical protein